jgi:uncharacterized membrane protein (DUF373 family)
MKEKLLDKSQSVIYYVLIVIALAYIVFQMVDLLVQFYLLIIHYAPLQNEEANPYSFSRVVVDFFNILISLEILETFRHHKNEVHYQTKIIILIAITAMTRKIITLDIKHADYLTDIGIAVLIISLTVGYYFIVQSNKVVTDKEELPG